MNTPYNGNGPPEGDQTLAELRHHLISDAKGGVPERLEELAGELQDKGIEVSVQFRAKFVVLKNSSVGCLAKLGS